MPDNFHEEHQETPGAMEKLRVYYDKTGNTLSVWFDDPQKEFVCEESDDDVVLVSCFSWNWNVRPFGLA